MLLRMAAELEATGALATCWFHGLSKGKRDCPRSVGTVRSSSSSRRSVAWREACLSCRRPASRRQKRASIVMSARSFLCASPTDGLACPGRQRGREVTVRGGSNDSPNDEDGGSERGRCEGDRAAMRGEVREV